MEIEVKRVDSQGRLVLPSDWRSEELTGVKEVYLIKGKGYIKVIAKRKVDLSKFFDRADLGVDSIGNWGDFEKAHAEKAKS